MINADNRKQRTHGGRRPGSGKPRKPIDQQHKRITVSIPPTTLAEVDAVVAPRMFSKYVTEVITNDLDRRRAERYDRVKAVTLGSGCVEIDVPTDDAPLWRFYGWRTKHIDDIEGDAVLVYEGDDVETRYESIARIVEGGS